MESTIKQQRRTARLAGLLYLIWIITGIYGIMYVPSRTMVAGDAAATAAKILANEFIFRTGILNDILSNTIWLFLALVLYKLFQSVDQHKASTLLVLVCVQVPAMFFIEALNVTALMIFKGEAFTAFEQRNDIAMLFLHINNNALIILEMFWGLWLVPFGQLAYKSGFIPRILGVFLIINGIAYMIHCLTHLLLPAYQEIIFQWATPFWVLGEISITLWLLIKGVRPRTIKLEQAID